MVNSQTIAAAAASLLLVPAASAMYSKSSPVLQLDGKSYDTLIAKSNHTAIVEFYAPWCGHCQNLKPAYEKAAKSLSGLAKVGAVDCDDESNKPFCGSMGVQGFPTLKIVKPGKKPGKPMVVAYRGGRNAKAIVDAVIDKIPNHVAVKVAVGELFQQHLPVHELYSAYVSGVHLSPRGVQGSFGFPAVVSMNGMR